MKMIENEAIVTQNRGLEEMSEAISRHKYGVGLPTE